MNELFFFPVIRKMTGTEYMLSEVMEPHLFVFRKQKRDSAEKVTPMLTYYVLDGSIYQAPQLCSVFAARVVSLFLLDLFWVFVISHNNITISSFMIGLNRICITNMVIRIISWKKRRVLLVQRSLELNSLHPM